MKLKIKCPIEFIFNCLSNCHQQQLAGLAVEKAVPQLASWWPMPSLALFLRPWYDQTTFMSDTGYDIEGVCNTGLETFLNQWSTLKQNPRKFLFQFCLTVRQKLVLKRLVPLWDIHGMKWRRVLCAVFSPLPSHFFADTDIQYKIYK